MYKNYIVISGTILILAVMLLAYSSADSATPVPLPETEVSASAAAEEPLYIIRAYDGYAALFLPEDTTPYKMLPVHLRTLTEADQQKIVAGIPIYTELELTLFLEDFSS